MEVTWSVRNYHWKSVGYGFSSISFSHEEDEVISPNFGNIIPSLKTYHLCKKIDLRATGYGPLSDNVRYGVRLFIIISIISYSVGGVWSIWGPFSTGSKLCGSEQ